MQQRPAWEADNYLASKEIPSLLWNTQLHYRAHKSPPPVYNLSQMNPFHTLRPDFLKTHCNIVLPSTPMSSEWSIPLRFSSQNVVRICCIPCASYVPLPSHLILLHLINLIIFSKKHKLRSFSLCKPSPVSWHFTFLRFKHSGKETWAYRPT
jgi:hypothetical protein